MTRAISQFGQKLARGSVGLFYFAGHGMQVRGKNFLIPIDAEIETEGSVSSEELSEALPKALAAGILQQDVEIPTLRSEITMLERQIEEAKKVLVDIEVMKNLAVEGARSPAALEQAVQMEIERDPIIVGSKQSIFELEQAINAQQSRGRNPNNSQLKRLSAQHQQAIGMMEQNRAGIEKGIRDKLSKIPNEGLRQTMMEYRIRFESTQANLKEYTDKLEVADKRLKTLGIKDPELEMLASEIEDLQVNVSEVEQKITMFNVKKTTQERNEVEGKKSDFEKVRVMAPAANQGVTNAIERWIVAGTGGLAGLALTCYGVALMEFRRRKLNQPTDMDEGLGVRVLGVLPPTTLKALASKSLVATQVAEAIDNVRVTLMHGAGAQRRKIVMIASPESMEGTTTVAASLALSLARSGRRTLLVDADLRSPSVHRLFGMSLEDGLSEVLRTQADLVDAIRPANNDNLYVLTAGAGDQVAVGALATDQPQAIFDKLRDQFDFVIVDAPPILGVSDSMSLGKHVDGVILTVLRDHSGVAAIHKSLEMLRSLGIRVIGTVVNGVPMKADRRVVRLHQSSGDLPKIAAKSAAE